MTPEIETQVQSLKWFHSIDLGDGLTSSGWMPLATLQYNAGLMFDPLSLEGKSVLDVGAWDGFFSFEAKRRGARRVLATDHFCWSGEGWGTQDGFLLARDLLGLDVEDQDIDLPELSRETVGEFDVVIFSGVLYHLKNPLAAIERMASLTRETLIVETHLDGDDYPRPAMVFYPGVELAGDPTNWWGPNQACVEAMLRCSGFESISSVRSRMAPTRGYFHARKAR